MTHSALDFTDPDFIADPYPALNELRKGDGPVWHEGMQIFWLPNMVMPMMCFEINH